MIVFSSSSSLISQSKKSNPAQNIDFFKFKIIFLGHSARRKVLEEEVGCRYRRVQKMAHVLPEPPLWAHGQRRHGHGK